MNPNGSKRPLIGLALGGGVARGWAHIGVLRALAEAGIEPDIVCGSSIGALVGGAHLAGHLDTLEEWVRGLNKRRMMGYLDLRLGGGGIIGGQRLARLMEQYFGGLKIEELPKPFAAVCSELPTGHEVWLQKGPLIDALRASYALPGVFPPVLRDGTWLVDGALVNPVPISVCRALGARLVIGVTLHAEVFGRGLVDLARGHKHSPEETDEDAILEEAASRGPKTPDRFIMRQIFGVGEKTPGLSTVMLSALNIILDRLSRSRMAGDPPDVLITPHVGHISLLDFDRADESIALGAEALNRELPAIRDCLSLLGLQPAAM